MEGVTAAYDKIQSLVDEIQNVKLHKICEWSRVRAHRFYSAFGSAADTSHHHAYPGGLAVHTVEVMELADRHAGSTYQLYNSAPCRDVILVAALFHDYAKIYDYDEGGNKLPYRKLVRHVNGSHAEFKSAVRAYGFEDIDPEISMNIEHCILSHHGRPEWGSPVEPQTIEAHILHYADNLSAKYGEGK
jgi:3'-5' exoribonuclease